MRYQLSLAFILTLVCSPWAQAAFSNGSARLLTNDEMTSNQYLASGDGRYRFYLQSDGNLVLRVVSNGQSLWSSGTHGKGGIRLKLQTDGNLVLRNKSGSSVWSSKSGGSGGVRFELQSDGNAVLYTASNRAVWATDTVQVSPDTTRPVISLNGSANISLVQGSAFSDPGATASDDRDGDISARIVRSGSVNTAVVGTYTLRYDVSDAAGNAAQTVSRTVNVTAPPVRSALSSGEQLLTDERLTSNNGQYRVTLQTDGNLVLRNSAGNPLWASGTNGTGAIRFVLQGDGNLVLRNAAGSAVWASGTNGRGGVRLLLQDDGNLVLLTASNTVVWSTGPAVTPDTTRPVISLNGSASMSLSQGATFTDPGATASDDRDGNISARIVRSGNVNTAVVGTYTLRYDVSDAAGNAAATVMRTVNVMAINNPSAPSTNNTDNDGRASSLGRFSAPSAALYSLNSARQRVFPRHVDTGFQGNGHAETWDGRVFVRTRTGGWFASAFRPERITVNSDGSPNFRNGAFGNSIELELESAAPDMQHNWLAIVPDPAVTGENPFPSNASGTFQANGTHRTYRALVIHTSKRNGDNDQMGQRRATFIVANAHTADAQLISARFTSSFARYSLPGGADFRCIEPSATLDGRLIICQGHPDNNGRIDNLVYSWNSTPGATSNWQAPRSIANMYFDDRNTLIAGIPFRVRYPIAERPLLDATGDDYGRNELVKGAYPWISHDGSELFFQATRKEANNTGARRSGTTVVGRWTGWTFRHIDGPINRNRHQTSRLFISSPGAFTTMWAPYKDQPNLPLPYSVNGPSYPIFGSNTQDYSEVGFDDYLDGNYVMYLGMNEQLDRAGIFQKTRTPDTSGNFNNATLVGARFPLEFNNQDILVGRFGQGIHFESGNHLNVSRANGWNSFNKGITVDFFVRKNSASGTVRLFTLQNGLEVTLSNGSTVSAAIVDTAGVRRTLSGPAISNGQWAHIAFSYNAFNREMKLYVDGAVVASGRADGFGTLQSSGAVQVGPVNSTASLIMDEVKVSNVARQPHEVAHNAYVRTHRAPSTALRNTVPVHLSSLANQVTAVDRFSSAAADLGELLFNDVILSKQRTTSCATCHDPRQAFTDGLPIARGKEPTDNGQRNTPTIFNRVFSSLQGWSGQAGSLDRQALVPIQAAHEMNLPMAEAVQRLSASSSYNSRFQSVYGQVPNAENIAAALASFQATQYAPRTRVDEYLAGNRSVLSAAEARGLQLFEGKARCSGCHAGANFSDESFRNNGMTTATQDLGRADMTGRNRDYRLFKVPTLRELSSTGPYMHDGSIDSLMEVLVTYNEGGLGDPMADTDIRPLELSNQELVDLEAFLRALSAR